MSEDYRPIKNEELVWGDCPRCDGVGEIEVRGKKISCTHCDGGKIWPMGFKCTRCFGEKELECADGNSVRKIPCLHCKQTGFEPEREEECPKCFGEKDLKCSSGGIVRDIPCFYCVHTGVVKTSRGLA